jgi:hypothetical protein
MYISKKHFYIIIAAIVILMAMFIIFSIYNDNSLNEENDEVIKLVEEFGEALKNVSLLAPKDVVVKAIEDNYSPYVTKELLRKWINDPRNAPGRISSSPWPERIEISEVERLSEGEYSVKGKIIEVTSTEVGSGGAAAVRAVELIVRRVGNNWLIDEMTTGKYE